MENVVRTKYLVFCSCCNAPTLFFKSTKEVFKVQGAWHSPNTLPTTVRGQAVCIKTWHTPFAIERTPLSVIQGHAEQLYEFEPCYISSVPSLCSGTSPVKPKTISLVFAVFCTKNASIMSNNKNWLARKIWIMHPSGATCLHVDLCFSVLALEKSNSAHRVGLVQSEHHHLMEI